MKSPRWFLAALLVCVGEQAQVPGIDEPLVCPAPAKVPVKDAPKPAAAAPRPSVEAARRTAEQEAADSTVLVAAEPMENFGVARYRVQDYADCVGDGGCYWKDLDAQLGRAEAALAAELKAHAGEAKLALVLDIDETTLSSYCEMKREDFGYIGEMFNAWVVTPEAGMGIPGTLRLYKEARAAGVAVFFLTGRPEEQRAATERNLRAVGFAGWAGVVLRNEAEKNMATVEYKSSERRKIVDAGYKLVMSVGDQWSDLTGEPKAEVSVKLPNPFYYLP
jgi:acid phosphatase